MSDHEQWTGGRDEDEAADLFSTKLEQVYARLAPVAKGRPRDAESETRRDEKGEPLETLFPGRARKDVLARVRHSYWVDVRKAWAERLAKDRKERQRTDSQDDDLPTAGVPGQNNWVTIGPSVARKGQPTGSPPIAGRVGGIAIAAGGTRVYVASADGGVWRSDDAGASWRATMDVLDTDPAGTPSTSNCCGAIAIDPGNPDRVYVGTGEGDVDEIFPSRLLRALPAYRGIGPVVSNDGGVSWTPEPTDTAASSLAGAAFFALAVDPANPDRVVGATTFGLYRREPDGAGGFHWVRKRTNKHTSVVACATGGVTTFYAAEWGTGVFSSTDGNTWTAAGTGFPTTGRITLAARPTDPSVLYALVANATTTDFEGLHRLDGGAGAWQTVSGLPALGGQSNYNLALAVDPNNANLVYMAGSVGPGGDGSIFRCAVTPSGATPPTYSMTSTFIGQGVHADVHVLAHAPGDSSTLWTGCDGGVWRTTTATGAGTFVHRNTGLATFCCNAFSQHPTQPAVGIVGLQDNGTARYTGEEAWLHVAHGDGGTPVIDWANPNNVMVKVNRNTFLATDGGQSVASFSAITGADAPIFGAPIVTTPYNPGTPADAGYVAYGSGRNAASFGCDLFISSTFGAAWSATPVATLPQRIFALDFASSSRLYVGTTGGQVYRLDRTGTTWSAPVAIHDATLQVAGLITDIEVDPFDTTGSSLYVTFGGVGEQRHVWHYDGTTWTNRSGTGGTALLDSSHNTIVVDPANTSDVYVGADVGVWHSPDRGVTWLPMQTGLPDAPVFDLQIHPTGRLLRASTHGRGMFEWKLDPPAQADVELYARDTALDVARVPTVDWLPDPETWPAESAVHYLSRNIKVDVPTPSGYQVPSPFDIDFLQFNDVIIDGSQHVGTLNAADGVVHNHVYVEVHNRGVVKANSVQVMLLVTRPSIALAPLPAGYEANVVAGTSISDANWQTVGINTLTNLRAGFPLVTRFDLPSSMLPPPADLPAHAHHCSVALLHSPQDAYSSTDTFVDNLTIADRKVAQRNLQVVAFVGVPPPGESVDRWVAVDVVGTDRRESPISLRIDVRHFHGQLDLLLPEEWARQGNFKEANHELVDEWAKVHRNRLEEFIDRELFDPAACKQMMADIGDAVQRPLMSATGGRKNVYTIKDVALGFGERMPLFMRIQPEGLKEGGLQGFDILQQDARTGAVVGGSRWHVTSPPGGVK